MRFAAMHRERLFPGVPLLIVGVEERRLAPAFPGTNTAAVLDSTDLALVVENILQVLRGTREVVVVFGASPLERFWSNECRRVFARFEERVRFRWLENLSFEAMKREVASLPTDSVVLYALLLRDAQGLSFEGQHALNRLRSVSNAPVFGFFESQLDAGIIGGRLFPDRSLGVKAAELGIRVLRGEDPASVNSPRMVALPWTFDWRELERWHIALDRLPPGSSVLFRPPSFWESYRWYVLGALTLISLQALLISGLLLQARRRSRAERQLAQSERRMHLIADSLPALIAYVDRDRRYVFINRAYQTWFGINPVKSQG